MARAYLGLGSNQGDRVALVNAALERLQASGRVRVIKRSSFYETAPVGVTDQPRFVNLVAEVHTDLDPQDLLELALAGEAAADGVPAAPGPAAGAVAGWATGGGRIRRGGGTDRRWEDNAGPVAGCAASRGGGAGSRGGESVSPPLLSGHAGLRLPD